MQKWIPFILFYFFFTFYRSKSMDDPDISSDPPETPIDLSNYYFNPKKAMANYLRVCRLITVLCNDLFRDILSH